VEGWTRESIPIANLIRFGFVKTPRLTNVIRLVCLDFSVQTSLKNKQTTISGSAVSVEAVHLQTSFTVLDTKEDPIEAV